MECLLNFEPYVQRFQAGDFTRAKTSETSFTSSANPYLKPESPRPQGASRQVPRPIFQKLSDSASLIGADSAAKVGVVSWGRLYRCCLLSHRSPVWDSQQFGDRRFEMVVLLSRLCTSSWKIQLSEVKLHSFTTCRQELIMDSMDWIRSTCFGETSPGCSLEEGTIC